MIVKLRLLLEYRCYPVWLYDEDNNIVDTLLPEELRSDSALDSKFDNIQEKFDSLFIDNKKEFRYVGFKNEVEKQRFITECNEAIKELTLKTNGRYRIINDIDV